MCTNFVKIMALIFFSFFIINSCQINPEEDEFSVYNEDGTLFKGSINLIGVPITFPLNTYPINSPFEIRGGVKNGKMEFGFPNKSIELNSEFENNYIGGSVRIGSLSISAKDNQNLQIGLHKINGEEYHRVNILYSSDEYTFSDDFDYSPVYSGTTIKVGWNFIELLDNPDWFYGSDEKSSLIIGFTSQNISDFLAKGYRWKIEYWA